MSLDTTTAPAAPGSAAADPAAARSVRSAGHLLVAQLEREGVTRVYGVPGESYRDGLDGLHDSSITTVVTRHEGGAAFMAVA